MKFLSTPKFWNDKSHPLKYCFFLFSLIYYILFQINKIKQIIFKKEIKIKTICVGNIYLGGTGKTPLTEKIYHNLKDIKKTCIIKKFRQNQIDEINMLNSKATIFTPKNRPAGLIEAEQKGFEIAILDDGMQDFSFKKNRSILCIKSEKGFGNENILPAGPLREPLSAIQNYEVAIINGEKNFVLENLLKSFKKDIKIFYSNYVLKNKEKFYDKKFFAFSGIADNKSFIDLLKKNDVNIVENKFFPDHYIFSDNQIEKYILKYKKEGVELITTEKNYNSISSKYKKDIFFTEIDLQIDNFKDFLNEIN